jgi:hypothetical protein
LIVHDQDRFFAYVLALLGFEPPGSLQGPSHDPGSWHRSRSASNDLTSSGLLERLIRAKSRDPEALAEIATLVDDLVLTPEGSRILPPGFRELWALFCDEARP